MWIMRLCKTPRAWAEAVAMRPRVASAGMVATPEHSLFSVHGQTAVVTNGVSGVGPVLVGGLVQAGAQVVLSGASPDGCRFIAEAVNAVAADDGGIGRCTAVVADLSTSDGIAELTTWLGAHHEKVDVLVNNGDDKPERWQDVALAALPLLKRAARTSRPACVINVSAGAVRRSALQSETRQLATTLAAKNIAVNAIAFDHGTDVLGAVRYLASAAGAHVSATVIGNLSAARDESAAVASPESAC